MMYYMGEKNQTNDNVVSVQEEKDFMNWKKRKFYQFYKSPVSKL